VEGFLLVVVVVMDAGFGGEVVVIRVMVEVEVDLKSQWLIVCVYYIL